MLRKIVQYLKDIYCDNCGKFLCRADGGVEIKCRGCGVIVRK